jgi:hypothetical protein
MIDLVAGQWSPHLPGWTVALSVAFMVLAGVTLITSGIGPALQRNAERRNIPRAAESARAVRMGGWLIILLAVVSFLTAALSGT